MLAVEEEEEDGPEKRMIRIDCGRIDDTEGMDMLVRWGMN